MTFDLPTTARSLRTPADLAAAGLVPEAAVAGLTSLAARYVVAVPPVIARTAAENPAVARQFVPDLRELDVRPDEISDPIGDRTHSPVKGIVHRYPDRVLLMPTLTCAVYCRFCFRRESVGGDEGLTRGELDNALAYIRATPAIWEVILTGGDPLVLSARRIGELVSALDIIPHVQVIRLHTRVPIAAPERVNDALIEALHRTRKAVFVAVHCNHAAELTAETLQACARLSDAGIPLVSQSVLLKDVNDTVEDLENLFRSLVQARIKPYYLHQLDYAPGTSHFRVPVDRGEALVRALRGRLSGLALPTYILDIPGGAGKIPLGAGYMSPEGDGGYVVRDPAGGKHSYPPAPPEKDDLPDRGIGRA
jgi:lysine 2,3-aminomutase